MLLSRRHWLGAIASFALALPVSRMALAGEPTLPPVKPALSTPFSFAWLAGEAERLAGADFTPPPVITSEWLKSLNYDTYRDVRFEKKKAIWADRNLPFQMELFHLGAIFTQPVEIYEVAGGQATRVAYDPALFNFGPLQVPEDAMQEISDYAGFRLHTALNNPNYLDEFLVFLGASYFRGVGKGQVYGLSARGLTVDTALPQGEEFPVFRRFWIERPARGAKSVTVYALLDSKSVAGAFRFVVTPGETTRMAVRSRLFIREDIDRMGVAPLTSMFAFGENDHRIDHDFRPEVHDSDGLLMHNGSGEWIWRPLMNPSELGVSSYALENPHGFGLLQRDRDFTSYEDLEARYEDRPSLWVEPEGDWGKGVVQLVEIPTDSEIHDNIVAHWIPDAPVKAGQKLAFDYTLSWGNGPDSAGRPAAVLATRVGRQFDHGSTKFVIDFEGRSGRYQKREDTLPRVDLWVSSGQVVGVSIEPNPHTGGWRVGFDLKPEADTIHELRCILRREGRAVSETWSYQWRPA